MDRAAINERISITDGIELILSGVGKVLRITATIISKLARNNQKNMVETSHSYNDERCHL